MGSKKIASKKDRIKSPDSAPKGGTAESVEVAVSDMSPSMKKE